MPVAFLLGLETSLPQFNWVRPRLQPSKLVYIGLRDVDAGEKRILREKGIKAFSMYDVDKYGIGAVVEMALDHVNPKRDLPIHLSFDIDALDPSVAGSTGTPVSDFVLMQRRAMIVKPHCDASQLDALLQRQQTGENCDEVRQEQPYDFGSAIRECE